MQGVRLLKQYVFWPSDLKQDFVQGVRFKVRLCAGRQTAETEQSDQLRPGGEPLIITKLSYY